MTRTIAAALALATIGSLGVSTAAEAKAHCRCVCPPKHHRKHHRIRHRTPAPRVVAPVAAPVTTVTKTVVPAETYVAPESLYLPDPQHPDHPVWTATKAELAIASPLNYLLDVWRSCAWKGTERAAASFAAWSRTHLVPARGADAGELRPAYEAFAVASAHRQPFLDEDAFNKSPVACGIGQGERADLKDRMDGLARALGRAHLEGHSAVVR